MKNHSSFQNTISQWCRKAGIPHRGGAGGTPKTCAGMFSAHTQPLRDRDLPEEDMRVLTMYAMRALVKPDARSAVAVALAKCGKMAALDRRPNGRTPNTQTTPSRLKRFGNREHGHRHSRSAPPAPAGVARPPRSPRPAWAKAAGRTPNTKLTPSRMKPRSGRPRRAIGMCQLAPEKSMLMVFAAGVGARSGVVALARALRSALPA